jgi:hypothetical protein
MSRASLVLALLTMACSGSDSGTGPPDAQVTGTWVITFSSTSTCTLSQLSLVLTAGQFGATGGSFGSYGITCPGISPGTEGPGTIESFRVSGNKVSVYVSTTPERVLGPATVNGAIMTGSFSWKGSHPQAYSIQGTFTAAKQ